MKDYKKSFSFKLSTFSFQLSAFSLVELIIVITILAILGIIAFLSFQSHTGKARDANRVSSIGIIKKGLELQFLKTGSYPVPDNLYGIGNIEGEIIVSVGSVGDNISKIINLDKTPKDPSSDIEYMYGVSYNKNKYQIGATLENIQASIIAPISYADSYYAKVEGNYKYPLKLNAKLYSLPSLLFVGTSDLVNNSTGFVINGGTNVPYSPSPSYVNTEDVSTQLETITGIQGLVVKSVDISNFANSNELKTASGYDVEEQMYSLGLDQTELGQAIFGQKYTDNVNIMNDIPHPEPVIVFSCYGDLVLANANVSNNKDLLENIEYQTTNSANPCYFTCNENYSGGNCETYTPPPSTCSATQPACYFVGGCVLTNGTPTQPNQPWIKGSSNCGYVCNANYSGNDCETYTQPPSSCSTTTPACSPNGCALTIGSPGTANQAWVKGSPNCGFSCKTNYSGNNCEIYTPPSCATNPTCAPTGCTLTIGTPITPNQAWVKGSPNCGYTCNINYSGTTCQTYTPPSCATNPTCSSAGCTLTTGTPTTTNQAWVKGSSNCGYTCKSGYSGTYCETFNPVDQEWKDIAGTSSDSEDIVFTDNGTKYRWAGSNSVLGSTGLGTYNGKCYSYSSSYGGTACFGDTTKENAYNASGQNNIWGKLYTWTYAVQANNACPNGWRLPTEYEFMKLEKYLGCSDYATQNAWRCSWLGWQGSSSRTASNNIIKALKLPLSGYRTGAGFLDRGASAYLWTATTYYIPTTGDTSKANARYLNYANAGISHQYYSKTQFGLSVRCIKATIVGPINGVCGEDNGKTLSSPPTNLCYEGTASTVSIGTWNWDWTCSGINGGGSVSCSASKPRLSTFTYNGQTYMVTPGGCSFTYIDNVVCNGGTDPTSGQPTAIRYCDRMTYLGYNDWFLPSLNELKAMYDYKWSIGNFVERYYWSSEYKDTGVRVYASFVHFKAGWSAVMNYEYGSYFRCVRK